MTDTQQENGQYVFDAGPPMVQVSRHPARELTLDAASQALILLGERYPKQFRECVGDALLGLE